MTEAYDLYGFISGDIGEARRCLEAALGIAFDEHDSDYQGGDYFAWGDESGEHFILKRNADPYDDEAAEQKFAEHAVIFYVNATGRAAELQHKITAACAGCALLRHEGLE